IPLANLKQAQLIPGIKLMPVANLAEVCRLLSAEPVFQDFKPDSTIALDDDPDDDFSGVIGQAAAKRALEIAAAGQHNVMLSGAPGPGKSMLAQALPGIIPAPDIEEILAIT